MEKLKTMSRQKGFIQIPLLIAIIAGVLVLGGAGYIGIKKYQNYQIQKSEKERLIIEQIQNKEAKSGSQNSQQTEIDALKKEVENLKSDKSKTLIKEAPKLESDLASIIGYWRPRVAHVRCSFETTSGYLTQSGSGLFMGNYSDDPNSLGVITNAHVASISNEKGTFKADFCEIQLSGDENIMTPNKISAAGGWVSGNDFDQDVSWIWGFTSPTKYARSIKTKTQFCTKRGSIGDEIVILGYPSIGSQTDITATEGIISGYDGYYYITSAKVEQGNSGGVAILINENCNLGIPTAAVTGKIESLGRVLDGKTAISWITR